MAVRTIRFQGGCNRDTSIGRLREIEANQARFSDPLHQRILNKIHSELDRENLQDGARQDWQQKANNHDHLENTN